MEAFLGQILLLPYTYAPSGWVRCEGQLLSIAQNEALYSLLGNQFDGDGMRTFALPDLRDKEPAPNLHFCIAVQGTYPMRD